MDAPLRLKAHATATPPSNPLNFPPPNPKTPPNKTKRCRYEDMASVRSMYEGMAADEQPDKINEGKAPMQVRHRTAR